MALHYLSSGVDLSAILTNESLVHVGDTVILEPGTYNIDCTLTRPVNIKGATTNDALGSVVLTGKGLNLSWSLQAAAPATRMVVEGVRWYSSNSPNSRAQIAFVSTPTFPGFEIVLNKCWMQAYGYTGGGPSPQSYVFSRGPDSNAKLRVVNSLCGKWEYRFNQWSGSGWWASSIPSAASFEQAVVEPQIPTQPTFDPDDWLDVNSGTQQGDYGWGGGSFLWPWADGSNFALGGQDLLEDGEDPSKTDIWIYRETEYLSGHMDNSPWIKTHPDPITGVWRVDYLPALNEAGAPQRYAVQINPPECYAPELLRWYTTEQIET